MAVELGMWVSAVMAMVAAAFVLTMRWSSEVQLNGCQSGSKMMC